MKKINILRRRYNLYKNLGNISRSAFRSQSEIYDGPFVAKIINR